MVDGSDIAGLDAVAVSAAVRVGELAVAEVLAAATNAYRQTHDSINAVVEWFSDPALPSPDALSGPLAGVPILAKDYGSAEAGRRVEMGSRVMAGNVAPSTAPFIARLQAAGAVIVGRSAVPEFIQHGTTESVLNGPTRNPYDPTMSAGGSSGGAGAAVAAGVVPVAHASDCAGSIRIPAAVCGLIGLKPAPATLPWVGGGWGGIATEFVVSRSARDSELLLDVLADGVPSARPGAMRIAMSTEHWAGATPDPVVIDATLAFAAKLAELGHHVQVVDPPVDYDALMATWHPLFSRWVVQHVHEAAKRFGRPVDKTMLEPITLGLAEAVGALTPADLEDAQDVRARLKQQVDEALADFDLLLTPSLGRSTIPLDFVDGMVASVDDYLERNDAIFPYHYLFNVVGWAAASIPARAGSSRHPVAVQLAGRPGTERTILRLARDLGR